MFSTSRKSFQAAAYLSVALLIGGGSLTAFADTIKLKDGSIIKGKVIDFKNQQMIVARSNGSNTRTSQITIDADEIASVEFDSIESLSALMNATRGDSASPVVSSTTRNSDNPQPTTPGNSVIVSNVNDNPVTAAPRPTPINPNVTTRPNTNPTTNQSGTLSGVINSQPLPSINNSLPRTTVGTGRFVPVSLKVLADNTANGWTNSGLVVKKGQRIRITSAGRVSLGAGKYTTPAGIGSLTDGDRLMKTEPTGALIAVIGDDNNDFIFIGSSREFDAPRDGTLFFGINEGNLEDNSGAFDTKIEAEAIDTTAQR